MSKETEILIEVLSTIEEICYAAKQKILQLYPPETPKTTNVANTPKPVIPQMSAKELSDIEMVFPEDIAQRLSFTQKDGYWIIKPKQFLGSEIFAKIATTVKGIGGDYVSAGRDSHFKTPIKKGV